MKEVVFVKKYVPSNVLYKTHI